MYGKGGREETEAPATVGSAKRGGGGRRRRTECLKFPLEKPGLKHGNDTKEKTTE